MTSTGTKGIPEIGECNAISPKECIKLSVYPLKPLLNS